LQRLRQERGGGVFVQGPGLLPVARPPLAAGSLQRISGDALSFKLKTPWQDGTTHLIFSPMEFIEKLAALVPPLRVNLIRYHGAFAPHTKNRAAYGDRNGTAWMHTVEAVFRGEGSARTN